MVEDNKIVRVGIVTLEGMGGAILNACVNRSVPKSVVDDISVFWKLEWPKRQSGPSFMNHIPFFFIQLAIILLGIHIVSFIFRPLRLPRFFLELLTGIMIVHAMPTWSIAYIVPVYSLKAIETLGYQSLIYYVFLVGLEFDVSTVRHLRWRAVYTGLTGMILPLLIGFIQFFVMSANPRYPNLFSREFWEHLAPVKLSGSIFWGVALAVTSFPDLARILSDIKLLHTDIGRLALSSSIISEFLTWILLIIALVLTSGTFNLLYVLPTFTFLVASWFLLRPVVGRVLRHANETDNKLLLSFTIFVGIITSTVITDACGANSITGAFMFGLIIPNGDVSGKLVDKFEDYFKGILMPLFFMVNGLKSNWRTSSMANNETPLYIIFLLIAMACSAKIASTFIFSKLAGMTTREAFTIGVLMNTKGTLALIVIHSARNNQGFNDLMYVVLVLSILVMSVIVIPLAKAATKSNKKPNQFKHRTVESSKLESELRILTCIHSTRNLSGMINLLESSNANKQYPISVFALYLVQLTDQRATAMLIVHNNNSNRMFEGSGENLSRREEESKHILTTFETLENRGASVSAELLTVVSPYTTMHEDISYIGEDKQVTLILVPFHKQADVNGRLQEENLSWRTVNKNLMATTTCSIGILVDRGFGFKDKTIQSQSSFVVIFIGGPDDREALAYGWRMAKTPNVNLTVLRLLPSDDAKHDDDVDRGIEKVSVKGGAIMRSKRDTRELDDEYVNEFRFKTMNDENISYIEKQVKTGEEVLTMIARVAPACDLYILGRNKNVASSIMLGLLEWMEFDELGVLGDALLASEFAQHSSVLVIKQHYVPRMCMWIRHNGNN